MISKTEMRKAMRAACPDVPGDILDHALSAALAVAAPAEDVRHPLIKCLQDNGDLIALKATVAQQAQMIKALQGEDVRAVVDERTPKDFAIEHAGYLATAADSVLESYKAYSLAQMNIDEGGDDGEGELAELVDGARNDLHEALQDLRGMTYEFRKRRDRATPQ